MTAHNYLNRRLADGIRKVGFRKWYEWELLSSHAHMVLALLCTIALMASLEAFAGGTLGEKLADVGFLLVSLAVGFWALRRYLFLLMRAELVANQAVCSACEAYGLLTVTEEDRRTGETRVCCRKCRHEWTIVP